MKANNRYEKSLVVHGIVDEIRSSGGRFLKNNYATGRWYELSDQQAKEKVGHAVRDAVSALDNRKKRKKRSSPFEEGKASSTDRKPPPSHQPNFHEAFASLSTAYHRQTAAALAGSASTSSTTGAASASQRPNIAFDPSSISSAYAAGLRPDEASSAAHPQAAVTQMLARVDRSSSLDHTRPYDPTANLMQPLVAGSGRGSAPGRLMLHDARQLHPAAGGMYDPRAVPVVAAAAAVGSGGPAGEEAAFPHEDPNQPDHNNHLDHGFLERIDSVLGPLHPEDPNMDPVERFLEEQRRRGLR